MTASSPLPPIPPFACARFSLPILCCALLPALLLFSGCRYSGPGDRAPQPPSLIGKTAFDPENPGQLDQARLDESRDATLEEQFELMGIYYQFGSLPDFEAGARGGLRWDLRKDMAQILEGAYSSRGKTEQNFDSSEVEGTLRLSTSV